MKKTNQSLTRPRNVFSVAAIALSTLVLTACGGGEEGRYFYGEGNEGITLELKGEGVAMITITGMPSVTGTYKVEDDRVTVTANGDVDVYRFQDGNLTTSGFGETMVFVRQ